MITAECYCVFSDVHTQYTGTLVLRDWISFYGLIFSLEYPVLEIECARLNIEQSIAKLSFSDAQGCTNVSVMNMD